MAVNATYIAAAPDLFDRMVRFSSETGYIFGHCIIILVALVALYRATQYNTSSAAAYAGFWSFLASVFLWAAGWESESAVIFCGSVLLLIVLFDGISSE